LRSRIGWLSVGQSVERIAQLFMTVLLVRLLAPELWGSTAMIIVTFFAAVTVASMNMEQGLLAYLPKFSPSEQGPLVTRTVVFLVGSGIVIGMVAAAFVGVRLDNRAVAVALWVAVALETPASIATAVLIARARTVAAGLWDAAHALVQLACVVAPAALGGGVVGVALGLVAASTVRGLAFLVLLGVVRTGAGRSTGRLVELLAICAPLGLAVAAGSLARVADKWIVAWGIPDAVGMFALAAQEVPILAALPYAGGAAVAVVLVQRLAEGDRDAAHAAWFRQAEVMCGAVVPLTFVVVTLAPELFEGLFGAGHSSSVVIFQMFTLIGLHRVTEYGVVLRAAGRTRDVVASSLLLLGLVVVLGIPGAVVGGTGGVASATVAAFSIAWWWVLGRVGEVFELGRREVFPWKVWMTEVVIGAIAAAAALVAGGSVDGTAARSAMKVAVFALVVVLGRALLRGHPAESRREMNTGETVHV
jgi:PST family polysaccharide transporter